MNFVRQRAHALALGPGDEWIDRCADELRADDSEIVDLSACADWDALNGPLCHAYRTGDWSAYTKELTAHMDVLLRERAEKRAIKQQEDNWADAGDCEGEAA